MLPAEAADGAVVAVHEVLPQPSLHRAGPYPEEVDHSCLVADHSCLVADHGCLVADHSHEGEAGGHDSSIPDLAHTRPDVVLLAEAHGQTPPVALLGSPLGLERVRLFHVVAHKMLPAWA